MFGFRAPDSTAKAFALALSGAAALSSFPSAAHAFTDRQCNVIQAAFSDYIRVNAASFSNEDRAELRRFNAWIGEGCRNSITLQRRPEVAAAMDAIQTFLSSSTNPEFRIQLASQVTLGPVVTGATAAPTVPVSIRNSGPTVQRAPGG